MYSDKHSVNTLTALLVAHGVKHAVVCPGSRNAPIVHNLNECPDIQCFPVTDERSAGFFALGIAQATDLPVVVCVTSGTALLNLAPAVAEAHYQHQSLIVISADRPAEWIDQLDGQTLPQPGALAPWVSKSVNLPEDAPRFCNRLTNEALMEATADHRPCVHINVPITEPLFHFTTPQLPQERVIRRYAPATDYDCLPQALLDDLFHAQRPMFVFGQLSSLRFHYEGLDHLFSHVIVLHETLSPLTSVSHFEEVLNVERSTFNVQRSTLIPDFIFYVGDAIVSKRLKQLLRQAEDARCWRVNLTGQVEDTFQNLRGVLVGDVEAILQSLNNKVSKYKLTNAAAEYRRQWLHLLTQAKQEIDAAPLHFGEEAAVRLFERAMFNVQRSTFNVQRSTFTVHYANSTAIRLANRYVQGHPVWCNRGVNGIEGSLSTAAGFSAAMPDEQVYCVIGDLSFFYDQNALWNQNIGGNLRILLLNNGHGAIFDHLPGLSQSAAANTLVAGRHAATAEGICRQNDIQYQSAHDMDQLRQGIEWLTASTAQRPLLLEVLCQ
ncbi:MAG: 2-succinyl-5-enolpyruvyl-6-hydroxy-3-cyclohexene-1-carboxylic-acid synthase [Prevotella sp.]|nr:2-succinyl-5-enolpyruvyl-6-hydroxy-3-cyclohexene-1-carboxylic-acid synthase [Prevotella sp.]